MSWELAEIELETEKLASAPATQISSYALPHNIFFVCLVSYASIHVPHLLKSHPAPIIEKLSQEKKEEKKKQKQTYNKNKKRTRTIYHKIIFYNCTTMVFFCLSAPPSFSIAGNKHFPFEVYHYNSIVK